MPAQYTPAQYTPGHHRFVESSPRRLKTIAPRLSNPLETCDRCGLGARFFVMLGPGGELYLCTRHTHEYEETLINLSATVQELPL